VPRRPRVQLRQKFDAWSKLNARRIGKGAAKRKVNGAGRKEGKKKGKQ
jgi:hypothetical protein